MDDEILGLTHYRATAHVRSHLAAHGVDVSRSDIETDIVRSGDRDVARTRIRMPHSSYSPRTGRAAGITQALDEWHDLGVKALRLLPDANRNITISMGDLVVEWSGLPPLIDDRATQRVVIDQASAVLAALALMRTYMQTGITVDMTVYIDAPLNSRSDICRVGGTILIRCTGRGPAAAAAWLDAVTEDWTIKVRGVEIEPSVGGVRIGAIPQ